MMEQDIREKSRLTIMYRLLRFIMLDNCEAMKVVNPKKEYGADVSDEVEVLHRLFGFEAVIRQGADTLTLRAEEDVWCQSVISQGYGRK